MYSSVLYAPKKSVVTVRCENCKAENKLDKCLVERSWKIQPDVTEVVSICPDCGHEKIFYFQSKELKLAQAQMSSTIKAVSQNLNQAGFEKIKKLKENYSILFLDEQKKFREMLESENERTA
jgi:ribosomal protein S27E